MVSIYHAFANGGAKEQDDRLLAKAQKQTSGDQIHKKLADVGTGNFVDLDHEVAAAAQAEETPAALQASLLD